MAKWITLVAVIAIIALAFKMRGDEPQPGSSQADTPPAEASSSSEDLHLQNPGQLAPVATNLRGKPIYVSAFKSVDISPDGNYVAVGSGDGVVVLWKLNPVKHLWSRQVSSNWVFDLHFSSDSTRIAVGTGDSQVDVIGLELKLPPRTNLHHNDDIHGVRFFSDDQKIISGSDDTHLQLWDLKKNSSSIITGHSKQVTAVAVSPDNKLIASASRDKTIRLWDAENLKPVATLEGHAADVMAIDFDSTSKYLVSGSYDKTVRIWDVEKKQELKQFSDFQEWVFATKFQPQGELIAVGDGQGKLSLINWKTGKTEHQELFQADIPSLDFADDGKTLVLVTIKTDAFLLKQENGQWIKQPSFPVSKPEGTSSRKQSFHLPTYELLELIDSLQKTDSPDWEPNYGKVVLNDAGIPLEILEGLAELPLTAPQQEMLDRSIARLKKQADSNELTPELLAAVGPRLEFAAYCDLTCHPHELTVTRWANDSLAKFKQDPLMIQELKRLQTEYRTTLDSKFIPKESLEKRVQQYLQKLLAAEEQSIDAKLQ